MTTIQEAYSTWNVSTPAIQAILEATWSALIDLWNWIAKNSLGIQASTVTNNTASTIPSCADQPTGIVNIWTFTVWVPTSAWQAWAYSSTPWNCTYTCKNWFGWTNCDPMTTYDHILSRWNRATYKDSLITYSYEGTWFRNETIGKIWSIIDGTKLYNGTNHMWLNTSSYTNNNSLIITFSLPTLVTEIKFYIWHSSSTKNHGSWVVQKYVNWAWSSDLCSPVQMSWENGAVSVFRLNNTDFTTQYRLKQVSWTVDWAWYFEEIEFKMLQ
ncbi:MAG: hypothetical protein ACD_2C00059G0001 [uncultured bacterium (gcode 4)]|uniref:Uncharacterized protein n=1 Tax=uncultured bacterium (gcode 4) TaxID=1234023 RepID=K2G453_9BACT|nr:MAG: hypothetical protein ACD_2C00059G0001 [uncultured bacterium (gcode 4)]